MADDVFTSMGTKYLSRHSRSCPVAQIETLEQRRFLSAPHYTATDISSYLGRKDAANIVIVGISDDGSVAIDNQEFGQGYLFSPHRHRLYRPVDNGSATALSPTGQLLLTTPVPQSQGGEIAFLDLNVATGQSRTLNFTLPSDGPTVNTGPTAVNAAGEIVGQQVTSHDVEPTGSYETYLPVALDQSNNQDAILQGSDPNGYSYPGPPLLNENGVIAYQQSLYTSASAQPLSLPAGDSDVGALSNTFAVGISGNGIYLYDLATHAQTVVGLPRGVQFFTPYAVNDAGVVVGSMSVYERVHGHPREATVAGVFEHGKFFNLNALANVPKGVNLTGAFAINDSGQIVASTDEGNTGGRVVLLSPSGL